MTAPGVVDAATLLEHYYRHVPAPELAERDDVTVLGAALSHARLAEHRLGGSATVRVYDPTVEADGWSLPATVVEVVSDDMPHLVDSVTSELTRQGLSISLVLHPVVLVDRDTDGRLTAAFRPSSTAESWIHVETGRVTEPAERQRISDRLVEVLADVRAVVEQRPDLQARALAVADQVGRLPASGVPAQEAVEAAELLRWLAQEDSTLLGYAEYSLSGADGERSVQAVEGSALGLLRRHGTGADGLAGSAPQALVADAAARLLVVSKAASPSTVQRPSYPDSIAVRTFDPSGRVVGEHRFLALFPPAAYTDSVLRVPVARRKAQEVLRRSGFGELSHSGRDLLQTLETHPRDEVFQAGVDDLEQVAHAVLRLRERRRLRVFLRRDHDGNYLSCLVYLPRDRYTSEVRGRMQHVLSEEVRAASVEFTVRLTESVLARVHFVARAEPGQQIADVDADALERRLADVARSWQDDFGGALAELVGEVEATRLQRTLPDAFPEGYRADHAAAAGAADLLRLAALPEDGFDLQLYAAGEGELRFKVLSREPLSLSAVLPVLQDMAVEVLDSRPYRLHAGSAHLYDFGLRAAGELHRDRTGLADLFSETFAAVWRGEAESDGLNALVLRGGLTCRQVVVLRAYAAYLRQGGWSFTPAYVAECLGAHAGVARLLVGLFEAQFNPDLAEPREELCEALATQVETALAEVPSLDQDRILRSFLHTVRATTRTNAYQRDESGRPLTRLALKLQPRRIPGLPEPRPDREIWVCSPRVEGVHLRFGAVARGGLRWSDRREDFRTEVLGLVKAQAVKNAVIVPVGAKGGFVAKRLPDPAVDREAWLREGIECYRTLIRGMLDLTDDLRDGEVVPPQRVVRRDGDDTYLVVAADKGTATFSDTANEVAAEYGFWLGDAFASGGSVGYDHKVMGITARGAWVSVERHFRELGVNPAVDPVTVVGIGDMSGDVFGNGMLLSRSLRVVAAFDHRHVFLDPDPDPSASYAERTRLFALSRSSWADYDRTLLSEGGGVHLRSAKSIPVTPQVRQRLGLPGDCTRLTPDELLSAILRAPVDLLWNGGIGTWVKATSETSADVGDKANDAVRVDGAELRCRVVGEGGNLGLTQLGRVEATMVGVRLNTDAIDNSAGVDCSDHEVNIKILLDQVVLAGDLAPDQRDELLAEMTHDVAELVLDHNREQNVLLGNARANSRSMLPVHRRYLQHLEASGALDRGVESLPSDSALQSRAAAGTGLSTPEFAVLTAYAKNTLNEQLLACGLPDEPWYEGHLLDYFPPQLPARFLAHVRRHPLRRQIIATSVVNELVDRAGTSFVFRAVEETGAMSQDVVRAGSVATDVFEMAQHWREVEQLRSPVGVDVQASLHLEARRLVDRVVRRQLAGSTGIDVGVQVRRYGPTVAALLPLVPEMVLRTEHDVLHAGVARRRAQGVPEALAVRSVSLLHSFPLLDVVDLAAAAREPPEPVARLHFALSAAFDLDTLLGRITELPRLDQWQSLARSALRDELYAALSALTADVLASTPPGPADQRIASWESGRSSAVSVARGRLLEIASGDVFDLAALSVAVRTVRKVLA